MKESHCDLFDTYNDQLVSDRRHLHRRPEEGWAEFETTYYVVERLKKLGIPVKYGREVIAQDSVYGRDPKIIEREIRRAVEHGVPESFIKEIDALTGAVGIFDTGRKGPVTAFRFDMDCVLVDEIKQPGHPPFDEGFVSERPGLMHSCGHDGHTAVGLSVARWLVDNKDKLCGTFKLVFQPAEEGVRGGAAIAASGIVDDAQFLFGGHVGCQCKPGEIAVCEGGFFSTTKLDIFFEGLASHAGNAPEEGRSALMAACSAAMMMQGIPRHGKGASRISIGRIDAGESRNVTPVHAHMQIETRGENDEINRYMEENVRNIVRATEAAYGVTSRIVTMGKAGTLVVCPEVIKEVARIAKTVPGVHSVSCDSSPSGSEDFTALLRRVTQKGGQGAFFIYGCNHHGHHRSDFDIQDKDNLPIAFGLFTALAQHYNAI